MWDGTGAIFIHIDTYIYVVTITHLILSFSPSELLIIHKVHIYYPIFVS